MFKLKVPQDKHKDLSEKLRIPNTLVYDYVLTTDKNLIEEDKINFVFDESHIHKLNNILDLIIKGDDLFIVGYNEFGKKRIECRDILYFEVEENLVYAVSYNSKIIVNYKLYEIEEMLSNKDYIRVNKSFLVNIGKVKYIKPALNSKLELLMENEKIIDVNRTYLKEFKKFLNI